MDTHNRRSKLEEYLEETPLYDNRIKELCCDEKIEDWFLGKIHEHKVFSIRLFAGDYFQFRMGFRRTAEPELKRLIQNRFAALFRRYARKGIIKKFNRYQYELCDEDEIQNKEKMEVLLEKVVS